MEGNLSREAKSRSASQHTIPLPWNEYKCSIPDKRRSHEYTFSIKKRGIQHKEEQTFLWAPLQYRIELRVLV
jgi:hypothetical protein